MWCIYSKVIKCDTYAVQSSNVDHEMQKYLATWKLVTKITETIYDAHHLGRLRGACKTSSYQANDHMGHPRAEDNGGEVLRPKDICLSFGAIVLQS